MWLEEIVTNKMQLNWTSLWSINPVKDEPLYCQPETDHKVVGPKPKIQYYTTHRKNCCWHTHETRTDLTRMLWPPLQFHLDELYSSQKNGTIVSCSFATSLWTQQMGIVSNKPQGRELSQGSFRNSDQKAAWVLWQISNFYIFMAKLGVRGSENALWTLHWKQLKLFMWHSSFVKAKDLNTKGWEPWQQSYTWKQWKWYHVSSPILTHPCKMEIESDKPCSWSNMVDPMCPSCGLFIKHGMACIQPAGRHWKRNCECWHLSSCSRSADKSSVEQLAAL